MTQEELRKISEVQLELMDEVHRICIKNNIRYYMAYGTLLGAVRHKGFIPWDDDLDVIMFRRDYVRFLEEAKWRKKSPEFYWPEPIVAAERLLSPVQFCRHW